MSKFSGKCDLYDHIMMAKMYPDPSNPNMLVSDELESFEIFKSATGGIIYQAKRVAVSTHNQELLAKLCKYFTFEAIPKKSTRSKQTFKYFYFGKEVDLKKLNKEGGICVEIPIKFNTLLDIIPYYPYLITCMTASEGKQRVTISSESYVESQLNDHLTYGYFPTFDYKVLLQKHYFEVISKYFDINGRKVTKTFNIDPDIDLTHFNLGEGVDYKFDIEVTRDKHSWIYSSPEIIDAEKGIVDISKVWPGETFETITLSFVRIMENQLYLE